MGDEELFSIDLDSSNEEHFDVRIDSKKCHFSLWNSWWIILNKEIFQHWYRSNQWSIGEKDEGDVAMVSQVWSKEENFSPISRLCSVSNRRQGKDSPVEWNVKIDSWGEYCPKNEVEENWIIEQDSLGHRVNWRGEKSFLHQSLWISMIKGFFSSLRLSTSMICFDWLSLSFFVQWNIGRKWIFFPNKIFLLPTIFLVETKEIDEEKFLRNENCKDFISIGLDHLREWMFPFPIEDHFVHQIDAKEKNNDELIFFKAIEKISFPRSFMKEEKYVQDEFVHCPSDRSVPKIIPMFDFDEQKLRQKRWRILQNLFASLILIRLIFLIESSRTKMRRLISWWSKSESIETSKRFFFCFFE